MNENGPTPKCPRCGATATADAPDGLCPRCLIALSLATQTDLTGDDVGADGTKVIKPPSPPAPPSEEIARLFPHLELLALLGQGGMGAVYKARQPKLDRLVALKVLLRRRADGTTDPAFSERFAREARALARLNHPSIVAVYEYGEAGGYPYLVMEYVDGLSLRQLLQRGRLAPEEALVIVPKICEALQFAHQKGIVHRDIKPENILLDKDGQVKIADFGISKMLVEAAPPLVPSADSLASAGAEGRIEAANLTQDQVLGTPHYMAPEQVEHPQRVDHRADIYSLGFVFYEMLTGELPLGKFQPPSRKVQIDVRLDEIVLHTLEKEPERRYQHASEIKTDVESIRSTGTPARQAGIERTCRIPGTNLALVESRNGQRLVNWTNVSLAWVLLLFAGALCLGSVAVVANQTGVYIKPDTLLTAGLVLAFVAAVVLSVAVRQFLRLPADEFESPSPSAKAASATLDSECVKKARRLVRWPATGLSAIGLSYVVAAGCFFGFASWPANWQDALGVCGVLAIIAINYVIILGAWRMRQLQDYRMAVLAAIVSLVAALPGLPLAAFPIWALMVLYRPDVRAAFNEVARKGASAPAGTPAHTSPASVPRPGVTRATVAGVAAAVVVLLVFLLAIVVPSLQRAPSAASAFGPEIEVSLSSLGSQAGDRFLDLDVGQLVRPPGAYSGWSRERKHEWLRQNGIDLMLMGSAFQSWSLLTPVDNAMRLTKVSAHAWQQGLDPEDAGRPPESAEAIQFLDQGVELLQVRLEGRPTHPDHTFAFQTANGARGVVKVSGLNLGAGDEIVGLNLRFKKSQAAAESTRNELPPAVMPRPEAVVFGPVTEVLLNDIDDMRGGEALDLDNGRLLDLPKDIEKQLKSEQSQWLKDHSADVFFDNVLDRWGLITPEVNELKLAPLPNEIWETATARDVSQALTAEPSGLEIKQHGSWTVYALATNAQPPLTCAFRTASGTSGLLQITRFRENPHCARLRYKLMQRAPHEAPEASPSPELILKTYANEVWTQLPTALESVEINDAEPKAAEMAADIARRLVLPHKEAIRSHLLDQLPRGRPLLRSQWTNLCDTTQLKAAPGFESFWNPITLAHTFQSLIVRERWGQEMLGTWQTLTDWAPPPDVLVNSDPDRPVIVTPFGNTLMVFRLERNTEGLYRLVRGEWLSRKPEASGGGQSYWMATTPRVVQEFSQTLWDRLVPRLEAVPMSEVVQTARDIGEVIVEPKHELLREEARRLLEKLPKAVAIDRAQWRSRVAQVTDADTLSTVREALNLSELGLLPLRWDPLRMVNRVRHAAFLRFEHPEAMARRAIVATLAGDPLHTVANADPEHPEMITRTGNELTVVRLKRDALGRYDLEALEWPVAK